MTMDDPRTFLLRYVGARFEGHRMPLDVLPDLSAFRDLLVSLVKAEWRAVHVNRERLPRGFEKSLSFDLVEIGDGSAVPKLEWDRNNVQMLLPEFKDELEGLVDNSYNKALALFDGADGHELSYRLNSENIRALNRFGSGLLDDEKIEFLGSEGADGNVIYLDSRRRKRLIMRDRDTYQTRFEDIGRLLGSEVDPENTGGGLISVTTDRHGTIRIPVSQERVREEFDGSIDADVQFRLLIEVDHKDIFRRVVEVFDVDVIDAAVVANLDRCRVRIATLRELKKGWHDGDGLAITDEAAAAAARLLTARPSLSGSYHIYPMDDGGLLFEFVHAGWDYSTEIGPKGAIEIYGVQVDGPRDVDAKGFESVNDDFLVHLDRLTQDRR
jgi:hypothetical protein